MAGLLRLFWYWSISFFFKETFKVEEKKKDTKENFTQAYMKIILDLFFLSHRSIDISHYVWN